MKNERYSMNRPAAEKQFEKTVSAKFTCPNCMMAATCSDCSRYSSDGYCNQWGGYNDPDKWACPWYYSH